MSITPSPITTPIGAPDPLIAWQRLRSGTARNPLPAGDIRANTDRPIAAVFRCADTGVPSETVFGQSSGSLIDVSTWGHVVDSGVMGALEYAVETLEVPLIVVLGHPECPAMAAAMRAWTDAVMPDGATRAVVEHAIGSIVHRGVGGGSIAEVTAAHIAETGLAVLERSPVIARKVDAGRCAIVCATADPTGSGITVHATVGAVGEVDGTLLECV